LVGLVLPPPQGHKMPNHSNATISHTLDTPACGSSVFVERSQDPYGIDHQLPDATVCRNCHASVRDGRWQWVGAPVGSTAILCPACRRIQDHLPAGSVSIEGDFFNRHRVELVNLVQTRANRAAAEHPLRRLMGGEDIPEGVRFTTTDTHLAREIGGALHDNYGGEVNFRYADGQDLLLVHWKR
jgi:NMD protein affecting ribosome stability and mRNA decay